MVPGWKVKYLIVKEERDLESWSRFGRWLQEQLGRGVVFDEDFACFLAI
jgi:hypothetical protein